MRRLTQEEGAIFEAALARFRAGAPEIGHQAADWKAIAECQFAEDVAGIRPDATDGERAEALPLIADLAINETAVAWQDEPRQTRGAA